MRKLLLILTATLTIAGCNIYSMEEVLLQQSDISLSWRGDMQVTYKASDCQLAYNDKRCEYRVYSDRLSDWFTIRCSEQPVSEGQTFTADVSWTSSKDIKRMKNLAFKVEKTDDQGLVWLWNESYRIGIIIKDIQ